MGRNLYTVKLNLIYTKNKTVCVNGVQQHFHSYSVDFYFVRVAIHMMAIKLMPFIASSYNTILNIVISANGMYE